MIYMGDEYGEFGGRDPDNRHPWRGDKTLNQREQKLLEAVRKLGTARHKHEALRRGNYTSLGSTETLMTFTRETAGDKLVVVINNADKEQSYTLPASPKPDQAYTDVSGLGAKPLYEALSNSWKVAVPARSCAILQESFP